MRPPFAPLLLSIAAAGLSGCSGGTPLYAPPESSFITQPITRVEKAIYKACADRGWIASKKSAHLIVATLQLRKHTAVVHITYDTDSYSIRYVSSENLGYRKHSDGRETIHPNFNAWLKNLSVDIGKNLAEQP